ncbi:MAG: orotate phosphoribosyltransferase, partial [Chloroflexi bacterium]|nr:orotate phosphoribosyltransferase [Chloroflexota bacterium]
MIAPSPLIGLSRERRRMELGQDLVHAAFLRGSFVLRSGRTSSYYFDKYLFETKPSILRRLAAFMAEMVPSGIDRIAGPELGAVPIATALSMELGLPFVIVKKAQKAYATGKQIEGEIYPGERIVLIEDVVTTGSQAIESGAILRSAGAVVTDVLVVVDREEGAAQ